jgi:predicted flap endonuclease-1-like 5' DNA nuclease
MHHLLTGSRARRAHGPVAGTKHGSTGDDLTTISGVGATRLHRLNEVGIHTFAHLAQADPAKLREALGASGHLVNVEEWIREAKSRL